VNYIENGTMDARDYWEAALRTGNLLRSITNIKPILFHAKDPTPEKLHGGFYKLSWGSCQGVYIGQSGRAFETRVREYKKAWHKGLTIASSEKTVPLAVQRLMVI